MSLYFTITKNKAKFLKFERNDDPYWLRYSYAEFLRTMAEDAFKCIDCGIYYWDGCKKRCKCN